MSFNLRAVAVATAIAVTASSFTVSSASAYMPGPVHHAPRYHGGGGGGIAAGAAAVGIGMLIGAAIAAQNARPPVVVREAPPPVKVKKPTVVRKSEPPVRIVKKDDLKPTLISVRQAHPVYVAPTLPADPVEVKNCGADCDKLWQSIQRYKAMIEEDSRKLADRKAELINRNAELKQHWEKSRTSAADWDKNYHAEMARNTEASISNIEESIESISKLIEQEQEILKDRIKQYEDCVKRACAAGPQAANKQ
jgi:hypothetical protein